MGTRMDGWVHEYVPGCRTDVNMDDGWVHKEIYGCMQGCMDVHG